MLARQLILKLNGAYCSSIEWRKTLTAPGLLTAHEEDEYEHF